VPLVARNAPRWSSRLLVLFLGVRPLAKALLKKRDDALARTARRSRSAQWPARRRRRGRYPMPPVSIDMLQKGGNGYDDRVGLVRGFTRDNPARAALGGARHDQGRRPVNALRSFNGVERAAVLMMLVGEEEAAAILQKLDPEEVRQLGKAMFAVADVSEAEVEQVLDDFTYKARGAPASVRSRAQDRRHDEPRAGRRARRKRALAIMPPQQAASIELLEWFEPDEIAAMIERSIRRSPRCCSRNLDPDIAGKVFERCPRPCSRRSCAASRGSARSRPRRSRRSRRCSPTAAACGKKSAGLQMGGTREAAKILQGARKITEQRG
jgi:hypothetical protein